jgi:tRNA threonylcarbamoyladenosine biosynthesis protein TsaB
MQPSQILMAEPAQAPLVVLGIDTCGPSGSVALGRMAGDEVEVLDQIQLEGRSFSTTLVTTVAQLLARRGFELKNLTAIVAVNGPGSFTGVRVGLSAVKGLAEAARISVVAVSRLEVLAAKGGAPWAALDAHRQEAFLRMASKGWESKELLAGAGELAEIDPTGSRIAICDDAIAELLTLAWPAAEQVRTLMPTAADALRFCAARILAGEFADLAMLDGHYLRRSDAEIFGGPAGPQRL